ncbi:5'-Nucleotidase domain-containing protein [Methanofollis liminatans DSM 4140]|jgi:5'-nucleotidase|uniref:5'-Nucleotidase domain-containing protein n=1 Tax=Methanofollis liminatans DSM 4140 TaxID=28892 RepID=J0S2Q7_9EURY|nr:bifunctional metallophosphatase/5'-nucleotidase [Methanofollis liminatans]EJG08206.1 5'-Nucleotidase domain-containing protein [Methanofollis liminatans DSM 4140]
MSPISPLSGRPVWQQAIIGATVLVCILLFIVALPYQVHPAPVHVQILAINDFHGQVSEGQNLDGEPAGSAPVLASYLEAALADEGQSATFIALPGDVVGASPPESGLLLDEPTMLFFNAFAEDCEGGPYTMIATFGNHEFDKGTAELMRKIEGGNGTTNITHLVDPYPGSNMTFVSSNVVWKTNDTPLVDPYVILDAGGVRIAFIGADTIKTPSIQKAANIEGVVFKDEAGSINRYVPEIQQEGVHAIVVLLHEGGEQEAYDGQTRNGGNVTGRVTEIVAALDPDVDVVLSAHTHEFTNAYLENAGKNPVLVTQAYSYSRAFADVDLYIDPVSGEIVDKSAEIVRAYADRPPGTSPDPEASAFLAADEQVVGPMIDRPVTTASADITGEQTGAGESALGNLVADAQRAAMGAEIAFVTTGSLRADIAKGNVTWGDLYAVQPFSSSVLSMTLTGAEVEDALERQWEAPLPPHNLAVSGLIYTYDATKPAGERVVAVLVNGTPLDPAANYTAAMVDFLAGGGDGYTVFTNGTDLAYGPVDVDALVSYMGTLPAPVEAPEQTRIAKTT